MDSAAGDPITSVPLTDVLTGKSNAPPGWEISHCTELNTSQMPRDCLGGGGGVGSFGIDWYIIFQESGSKYDLSSLIFQERGSNLHKFCFHSQ